jgi:hypothetical protein
MNLFSKFVCFSIFVTLYTSLFANAAMGAPTANDDTYASLPERHIDQDVSLSVLDNDIDADKSTLVIDLPSAVSEGGLPVQVGTDGQSIILTVPKGWNGTDVVRYRITDSLGLTSNIASVTVTFVDANDPPIAVRDRHLISRRTNCNADTPNTGTHVLIHCRYDLSNLFSNDLDEDSSASGLRLGKVFVNGSEASSANYLGSGELFYLTTRGVAMIGDDGSLQYIPSPNSFRSVVDSFEYTVVDDQGQESDRTTVTFYMVSSLAPNTPPEIDLVTPNDGASFEESDIIELSATITNSDHNDSAILSFQLDDGTPQVVGAPPYAHSVGPLSAGIHTVTYQATDAEGAQSEVVTLRIQVNASAPDIPLGISAIQNATEILLSWDSVAEAERYEIEVEHRANQASAWVAEDGVITVASPDTAYSWASALQVAGEYRYRVKACLFNACSVLSAYSSIILIDAIPAGAPPVANDDVYLNLPERHVDLDVSLSVLDNDVDADKSTLVIDLPSAVSEGGLPVQVGTDGQSIILTVPKGWNGTDVVRYRITDSLGLTSNIASVTVTFVDANDPPIAVRDRHLISRRTNCNADTPNTGTHVLIHCRYDLSNLFSNDLDEDSPASGLRLGKVIVLNEEAIPGDYLGAGEPQYLTRHGAVTIEANGDIQYIPAPKAFQLGFDTFRYTVIDDQGLESDEAIFVTNFTPVPNRPPEISSASPINGASYTTDDLIEVSAVVTDLDDNDSVTLSVTVGGTSILVSNAPYVASIGPLSPGSHAITFQATDEDGEQSAIVTRTIQVSSTSSNNTFTVSPSSIRVGQSVSLTWNVSSAMSCSVLSGNDVLRSNLSGAETNYALTLYTVGTDLNLSCVDSSGATMPVMSATLTVQRLSAPTLNQPVVQ